jgi:hypothetical protein
MFSTRLPTALASKVCAHLTLGEFVRFRRVSRRAKTISECKSASPAAVGYYGAAVLLARPRSIDIIGTPPGWTVVVPSIVSPTPGNSTGESKRGGDDASAETQIATNNLLPLGLLRGTRPRCAVLEVDQERVDQLVAAVSTAASGRRPVVTTECKEIVDDADAADAADLSKHFRGAAAATTTTTTTTTTTVATGATGASDEKVSRWPESLRGLALVIRSTEVDDVDVWSVRDLSALTCMTGLRALRLYTTRPLGPNGVASAQLLAAHLPQLPRLSKFEIEHLCGGQALRDVARAFPNLRRLENIKLMPYFTEDEAEAEIAAGDWSGFACLRCLVATVDARRAQWVLPYGLAKLDLRVFSSEQWEEYGFPDPCRPLAPLVDYLCGGAKDATSRLRLLSINCYAASAAPFWLFFDVPTLRELELRNILHAHGIDGVRADADAAVVLEDGKSGQQNGASATAVESGDNDGRATSVDTEADSGTERKAAVAAGAIKRRTSLLEAVRLRGNASTSAMRLPSTWFPHLRALCIVAQRCNLDALRWRTDANIDLTLASVPASSVSSLSVAAT